MMSAAQDGTQPGTRNTRTQFTEEEDNRIRKLVEEDHVSNWNTIAQQLPGRSPRSVRERYFNYLRPNLRKGPFTPDEDEKLLFYVENLGQKWSEITRFFDGRTDVHLKNRYICLRRNLLKFAVPSPLITPPIRNSQFVPPPPQVPPTPADPSESDDINETGFNNFPGFFGDWLFQNSYNANPEWECEMDQIY
jgi:hypothetical protein